MNNSQFLIFSSQLAILALLLPAGLILLAGGQEQGKNCELRAENQEL